MANSRFATTARSTVFDSYDAATARRKERDAPAFPHQNASSATATYGFQGALGQRPNPYGYAYTSQNTDKKGGYAYPGDAGAGGYRSATPNSRGQYSSATYENLESQNEEGISAMSSRVAALKELTTAIGVEIRSSSTLVDSMNETFEGTRVRLRGTMNRMLRMAERTGVGWRVWVGVFAAIILLFVIVRGI